MIVEEVEVSYLLMSMSDCSSLLIDCSGLLSTGGNQICKKCRNTGDVAIVKIMRHITVNLMLSLSFVFSNDKLTL